MLDRKTLKRINRASKLYNPVKKARDMRIERVIYQGLLR